MGHYLTGTVVLFHVPVSPKVLEPRLKHRHPNLLCVCLSSPLFPIFPVLHGSRASKEKIETLKAGQKHQAKALSFLRQVAQAGLSEAEL